MINKHLWSGLVAGLCVAVTVWGQGHAQNRPQRKITIGYVPAAYYLPIFVLKDQRLLERLGYEVDVKEYQRNTDMINDFTAGRLDMTAQSSLTMFPLEARFPDRFKFVYGQNNRSYAFVVPKDSPIRSLKDLEGKTIATWSSPTAQAAIQLTLRPIIHDQNRIIIQRVGFADLVALLREKKVDAVFSTDVYVAEAIREGIGRYLVQYPLPTYVVDPFFSGGGIISPSLVAREPQVAADIQAACDEAIAFIERSPAEARRLITKYAKAVAEADAMSAELDEFFPVARVDVSRAQFLADKLSDVGDLMERRINVNKLFLRLPKTRR